jgi:glycosyltransferase involved in cell wall biosynthesis
MDWARECAAVIPCLNEAAAIEAVVVEVRRYLPTAIVVDDGSCDATGELARQAGAEVRRHEQPRGKGAALQTGLRHALDRGFDWALMLDGDGQHSPDDIPSLLDRASRTNAALVIGNRMANPREMPWLRRFVNRWMSKQLSRLAGCSLPDTQCGFRLMRLDSWSRLPMRATHFEVESEVLLAFIEERLPVEFVPIRVIYKTEQSKIHPVRDTIRWFRWLRGVQRR